MPDANVTQAPPAPVGGPAAISVLLVDESASSRRLLRGALQATDEFVVVGEARTVRDAAMLVDRLQPATVLMHLDSPVAVGLAAIESIMAARPTPIIVYSGELGADGKGSALDALSAGAVEVVAKPDWDNPAGVDRYVAELRRLLRAASRIKVITHPRGKLRTAAQPPPETAAAVVSERAIRLVVIGASTGGPQALAQVLGALPADFAPAVLVVQHMAEGFIPGLVSWLDTVSPLTVGIAEAGRVLRPGSVSIAPSGHNVQVGRNLRVLLSEPSARQFHVPGIDPAFCSVAESIGPHAIGILLTGMGRDGAEGLKSLRDAGAVTIGQDEASSAVYGMPGVAMTLGGVEHQLPLNEIASTVVRLVRSAS